jgi:hypothetical protein
MSRITKRHCRSACSRSTLRKGLRPEIAATDGACYRPDVSLRASPGADGIRTDLAARRTLTTSLTCAGAGINAAVVRCRRDLGEPAHDAVQAVKDLIDAG